MHYTGTIAQCLGQITFSGVWNDLQQRPGNQGVGLTRSIPLIDWGENMARVHSAEATLNQNLIQLSGYKISIEGDVRKTVNRLQSNLRRLQLLEKTVVIAEKSFEISRQRYSNGDIDSQAMALERERLNTAYLPGWMRLSTINSFWPILCAKPFTISRGMYRYWQCRSFNGIDWIHYHM